MTGNDMGITCRPISYSVWDDNWMTGWNQVLLFLFLGVNGLRAGRGTALALHFGTQLADF